MFFVCVSTVRVFRRHGLDDGIAIIINISDLTTIITTSSMISTSTTTTITIITIIFVISDVAASMEPRPFTSAMMSPT